MMAGSRSFCVVELEKLRSYRACRILLRATALEQVPMEQLRQYKRQNITFERDSTFGVQQPEPEKPEPAQVEEKQPHRLELRMALMSVCNTRPNPT